MQIVVVVSRLYDEPSLAHTFVAARMTCLCLFVFIVWLCFSGHFGEAVMMSCRRGRIPGVGAVRALHLVNPEVMTRSDVCFRDS